MRGVLQGGAHRHFKPGADLSDGCGGAGARPSRIQQLRLTYYPAAGLRWPPRLVPMHTREDVLGLALVHHERSRSTHRSVNRLSTLLPHRPTAFGRRASIRLIVDTIGEHCTEHPLQGPRLLAQA